MEELTAVQAVCISSGGGEILCFRINLSFSFTINTLSIYLKTLMHSLLGLLYSQKEDVIFTEKYSFLKKCIPFSNQMKISVMMPLNPLSIFSSTRTNTFSEEEITICHPTCRSIQERGQLCISLVPLMLEEPVTVKFTLAKGKQAASLSWLGTPHIKSLEEGG